MLNYGEWATQDPSLCNRYIPEPSYSDNCDGTLFCVETALTSHCKCLTCWGINIIGDIICVPYMYFFI